MTNNIEEISAKYTQSKDDFAAYCHSNMFYTRELVVNSFGKRILATAACYIQYLLPAILVIIWIVYANPFYFDNPRSNFQNSVIRNLFVFIMIASVLTTFVSGYIAYKSKFGMFWNVFELQRNKTFDVKLTAVRTHVITTGSDRKNSWPKNRTIFKVWRKHLIVIIPNEALVIPVDTLNVSPETALKLLREWTS